MKNLNGVERNKVLSDYSHSIINVTCNPLLYCDLFSLCIAFLPSDLPSIAIHNPEMLSASIARYQSQSTPRDD
jgi:hypothetical protein